MQLRPHGKTGARPDPLDSPLTVRVLESEASALEPVVEALDCDDEFSVETVATQSTALEDLDSVECVVSVVDRPDEDTLTFLEKLRERAPRLPYVLVAADPPGSVTDRLLSTRATDLFCVTEAPEMADLFRRRVRLLVGHHRAMALARRSTAAIETTTQGVAIVEPNGTIQFANRLFSHQLGYTTDDVVGRPWRDFFTDEAADRIESDALPSVAEGWRWVGSCVSRRPDGETTPISTAITRLDDDSLVFTLSDESSDEPSAGME